MIVAVAAWLDPRRRMTTTRESVSRRYRELMTWERWVQVGSAAPEGNGIVLSRKSR